MIHTIHHPWKVLFILIYEGYDGLVDMGYNRHMRVNKSKSFVKHGIYINDIEAFWSFSKRRLIKFNE